MEADNLGIFFVALGYFSLGIWMSKIIIKFIPETIFIVLVFSSLILGLSIYKVKNLWEKIGMTYT